MEVHLNRETRGGEFSVPSVKDVMDEVFVGAGLSTQDAAGAECSGEVHGAHVLFVPCAATILV